MLNGIKEYLTFANNALKANNQFYITSTNGKGTINFSKTPLQFAQQLPPLIHIYLTSIQDEEEPYGIVVFDFVLGKLFSNEITTLLIN
ncbi:hypothetical protein ACWNT8_12150 [Pigmentibacter ruber]|nr:hypothetical protein GTC16762_15640 [Pigmentibacter ruber]